MGAATLPFKQLRAEETGEEKEFMGILVDTTRCVGCQTCEEVCGPYTRTARFSRGTGGAQ